MSNSYKMIAKLELMRAACGLRLPAYESRTLIALASLINEKTGCAYPPRSLLANLVNIDERNLVRALRGLQGRGLMTISEPGTSRRASRYAINEAAVMAARGVSTDTSGVSLQTRQGCLHRHIRGVSTDTAGVSLETRQGCLHRHIRGVSTDTAGVSLETPEGQRRAKQAQAKRQPKLSASLSARGTLRGSSGPRAEQRTIRNAWLAKYREAAD